MPVSPSADAPSALSNVSGSASSVTILAANTSRSGAVVYNESAATLYLAYASSSATNAYTYQVGQNGLWEMPSGQKYKGIITGIWSSANGTARVTELS